MINKPYYVPAPTLEIPDGMDGAVDVDGIIKKRMAGLQKEVNEALAHFIMGSIMDNANAYKARNLDWPADCYLTHEQYTLLKESSVAPRSLLYDYDSPVAKLHDMHVKLVPQDRKPLEVGG